METPLTLKQRFSRRRFRLGEATGQSPLQLNHRRIFILPTKPGLGFFLLLALLWLTSANYNNNLGFILTYLLGSVALVSIIETYRQLSGLNVQPDKFESSFAGSTTLLRIHLQNPKAYPRHAITLRHRYGNDLTLTIPERSERLLEWVLSCPKRGHHRLGTITIATTFPLGLFRAWAPIDYQLDWWVYPKPVGGAVPLPEQLTIDCLSSPSQALDFHGLRAYQAGDSLKHIYWKGLAKGQNLHSKIFADEPASPPELWLDWNRTSGSDIEARLSQLCSWVLQAQRQGKRYGLRMPAKSLKVGSGSEHSTACLKLLAGFPYG